MQGIETIAAKILADATAEADELRRASELECAEIAEHFRAEAELEAAKILDAGKLEVARLAERYAAMAQSATKKALLTEKQLLVAEAFALAAAKLERVRESGAFDVELVRHDGSRERTRNVAMVLEQRREELTPRVAEILFSQQSGR